MKALGNSLIVLAIFWTLIIVADIGAGFTHPDTQFVFNWLDFWKIAGYLGIPIAMFVLGIAMRRRNDSRAHALRVPCEGTQTPA